MNHISQEKLHWLFDYLDGFLIWKVGNAIGKVAGVFNAWTGRPIYESIKIGYINYSVHRLVYIYHYGRIPPGGVIGHKNDIDIDNRIENLYLKKLGPDYERVLMLDGNSVVDLDTLPGKLQYEPDYITERKELEKILLESIEKLPPRKRDIIKSRYGLNCNPITLREVGNGYGFTRERTRQIEVQAIRALRYICSNELNNFIYLLKNYNDYSSMSQ